jgi:hypothetical protein
MTTTTFTDISFRQPPVDPVERAEWLAKQEERIAKRTRKVMTDLITNATEMFIGSLTASGDMSAFDSIIEGWDSYATGELVEDLQGMYLAGGVVAYETASTTGNFTTALADTWINIVNQTAVDYAADATNRMKDVGLTAWNNIKNNVAVAVEEGTSVENLKKLLEKNKSFSEYRADTIARTEVGNALLNGSWNGMAALGEYGPTHKIWIAAQDDRSRETHIAVATKVLPINEPYLVGGEPMMYPHSPGASAKNVVNCRCDIGYLYPGDVNPYTGETIPAPMAASPQTTQPPVDRFRPVKDARPFEDDDEMIAFSDRQTRSGLTHQNFRTQTQSVAEYKGQGYGQINSFLRGTRQPGEALRRILQKQVDDIDYVMSKAPALEEPIIVYRGVGSRFGKILRSLKVGDEYVDDAFVSTSMNQEAAIDFIPDDDGAFLEIICPAGSKGFMPETFLGEFTYNSAQGEAEWLLPRGSRFRILSILPNKITVQVVL